MSQHKVKVGFYFKGYQHDINGHATFKLKGHIMSNDSEYRMVDLDAFKLKIDMVELTEVVRVAMENYLNEKNK